MIGLLLVLLAIAAVCARLGVWQLDRAQRAGAADAPDDAVAPLAEVLAPQETFTGAADGRRVEARGRFGADEVLVPRALAGEDGYLVVTPLEVAGAPGDGDGDVGGEGDGATLAVVRGWVPGVGDADAAPAPPGEVTVTGVLQVGEAAGDDAGLPAGQVAAVSPAALVNRWGGPMYSGYLLLTDVRPGQDGLELVSPPERGGGWDVQNVAYALQWWLFGGFAVLLWARLVRDEARRVDAADAADRVDRVDTADTVDGAGDDGTGDPADVLTPGTTGAGGAAAP